jgi:hypothetical protein
MKCRSIIVNKSGDFIIYIYIVPVFLARGPRRGHLHVPDQRHLRDGRRRQQQTPLHPDSAGPPAQWGRRKGEWGRKAEMKSTMITVFLHFSGIKSSRRLCTPTAPGTSLPAAVTN